MLLGKVFGLEAVILTQDHSIYHSLIEQILILNSVSNLGVEDCKTHFTPKTVMMIKKKKKNIHFHVDVKATGGHCRGALELHLADPCSTWKLIKQSYW